MEVERGGACVPDLDVLVADDDAVLLRALRRQLMQLGYRVVAAPGGREAIEALAARPFDVVVCDLVMPGFDGLDVQAAARAAHPAPAFIMLSGDPDRDDVLETFRNGATDVLIKPASVADLNRALRHAAGARKGKAPADRARRGADPTARDPDIEPFVEALRATAELPPPAPRARRLLGGAARSDAPSPRGAEAVAGADATLALHALRAVTPPALDLRAAIDRLGPRRALAAAATALRVPASRTWDDADSAVWLNHLLTATLAARLAAAHAAVDARATHTGTLVLLAGESVAWRAARQAAEGGRPAPAIEAAIGARWPHLGGLLLERWLPDPTGDVRRGAEAALPFARLARRVVATRVPSPLTSRDDPLLGDAAALADRVGTAGLAIALRGAVDAVKALLGGQLPA